MAEPTIQQAFGDSASYDAATSELIIFANELDQRLEEFDASSEGLLYAILSRFNEFQDTEPNTQCVITRTIPPLQEGDDPDKLRVRFQVDFMTEAELDPRNL